MRTLPFVAVLVVATGLVYGPGLAAPLVFDDLDAIVANPTIRTLSWSTLSPPPQTPVAGRPLPNLTFALSYALGGLDPPVLRAPSLLLHLLNALLAFWLVRTLLARPVVPEPLRARHAAVARAVALLWLVHPLASETVMYVTQRTEQLAATLYLSALACAVKAFGGERGRTFGALAVLACLLGVLCKETIVSAPLAIALVDRGFFARDWRSPWRERRGLYLGLALSWLLLAGVLAGSPRGHTAGLGLGIDPLQALATQGSVILHYLKLALLPHPLSISYDWPLAEPLGRYWLQDAAIAALFVAGLAWAWRRPFTGLPWLLFFGVLAPSSSVVPVLGELAAERRMYLPLLALCALVVCVATAVLARHRFARALGVPLVTALALAYAATTAARVQDYGSEQALWRKTLRHQPDNPIALWGLGDALARAGEHAQALSLYERMARAGRPYRGPFSWGARGLLAAAKVQRARGDAALADATERRAFAHDPRSALGTLHRAVQHRVRGQPERARALAAALLAGPHLHAEARWLLGQLEHDRGDAAAAARERAEAQRLDSSGAALALVKQLVALEKRAP